MPILLTMTLKSINFGIERINYNNDNVIGTVR